MRRRSDGPLRALVLAGVLALGCVATKAPQPEPAPAPQTELAAPEQPSWLGPAFRAALARLAHTEPLRAPVEVRVVALEGRWGQAWFDAPSGHFVIELDDSIPGPELDWALDVLIHEWAHCLVMQAAQDGHHDDLWGVAVARCYRAVHGL